MKGQINEFNINGLHMVNPITSIENVVLNGSYPYSDLAHKMGREPQIFFFMNEDSMFAELYLNFEEILTWYIYIFFLQMHSMETYMLHI